MDHMANPFFRELIIVLIAIAHIISVPVHLELSTLCDKPLWRNPFHGPGLSRVVTLQTCSSLNSEKIALV